MVEVLSDFDFQGFEQCEPWVPHEFRQSAIEEAAISLDPYAGFISEVDKRRTLRLYLSDALAQGVLLYCDVHREDGATEFPDYESALKPVIFLNLIGPSITNSHGPVMSPHYMKEELMRIPIERTALGGIPAVAQFVAFQNNHIEVSVEAQDARNEVTLAAIHAVQRISQLEFGPQLDHYLEAVLSGGLVADAEFDRVYDSLFENLQASGISFRRQLFFYQVKPLIQALAKRFCQPLNTKMLKVLLSFFQPVLTQLRP